MFPETMSLLAPLDDFLLRTLARVPGAWGKLYYLSSLRDAEGSYRHWGMIRSYGEQAAGQTMAEAHQIAVLRLLRTPMAELLRDVQESAAARNQTIPEFVHVLATRMPALLPKQMAGGSALHFNSVLQALACLTRADKGSTHPAS